MSKGHYPTRIDPINLPRRLREGLIEAETLMEKGKASDAKSLLNELNKKYPNQPDVLGMTANACIDLEDGHGYLIAMLALHKLRPNSPDINLGLARAYLKNFRPALALRTFARFLDRWPGHPSADDARKTVEDLQRGLQEAYLALKLPEDASFEFACKHEELQVCLASGQYQRGKSLVEELQERKPDFAPAYNNLSQIYWLEGDLPKAIQVCNEVLGFEPDNVHALGNIVRYLYLSGQKSEAPQYVERLKKSTAEASDRWKKISETLSFIGDDEGMLSLREQVLKEGGSKEVDETFYHFLAVSEAMLGQENAAKADWKRALKINPNFIPAQENLADLKRPKHERNGPWAIPFAQMITEKVILEMTRVVERAAKSKDDAAFHPTIQRFLDAHPELLQLAPLLLERGDHTAKELVINIADMSAHPGFLALLKEFAFGQKSSDEVRLKAAQILSKHNAAPTGKVDMWIKGQWTQILLLGFEITPEPMLDEDPMRPKVLALMKQAIGALHEENGELAEQHLRKALLLQPEHPGLLNNLALALLFQDKNEEAKALLEHITNDFPDYFLGQMALARELMQQGNTEKARAIIDHWMDTKKKYHTTEFSALCKAQIDLMLAEGLHEGIDAWLGMWEKAYPEDPDIDHFKELVRIRKRIDKLMRKKPRTKE
jgi:tetratricopeptide (TPR) repeat protein